MCNCAVNWCDKLCFLHLCISRPTIGIYNPVSVSRIPFSGQFLPRDATQSTVFIVNRIFEVHTQAQ